MFDPRYQSGLTACWRGSGWSVRLTWVMPVRTCSPFAANPLGAGGSWGGQGGHTDCRSGHGCTQHSCCWIKQTASASFQDLPSSQSTDDGEWTSSGKLMLFCF